MLLHDSVNGRQAEAGAFANFLGGKKWFKDARQNFRGDAAAIIGELQANP